MSRIKWLRKTRTQRCLFPFSTEHWNVLKLFSLSLFSSLLCPFAWYPCWCCPRHFSLLITTLQTEHTSKWVQCRADSCKAGPYPDANCEKHTFWITLYEFQSALSVSLGVIFWGSHFWTSLHDLQHFQYQMSYGWQLLLKHLCLLPWLQNKSLNRSCLSKLGKSLFSCCNASVRIKKHKPLHCWAFFPFR